MKKDLLLALRSGETLTLRQQTLLALQLSIPAILAQVSSIAMQYIDSSMVGHLGREASAAIGLVASSTWLLGGLCRALTVGFCVQTAQRIGAGEEKDARNLVRQSLVLGIAFGLVLALVGSAVSGNLPRWLGAEESIWQGASVYFLIFALSLPALQMNSLVAALLQASGNMRTPSALLVLMCGLDVVFNLLLIFGLCGFPKLGVAGAAYATVLGQCVAASIGLFLNLRYNKDIHFSLREVFHPVLPIIGKIYFVGVPSILMMSIGSVMTYFMNLILVGFSTTAAAVFGVYFKLQSFFFMPVFGLNNGLIPVLAYNYGAREKARIDQALRFSLLLAICIMLCGTITFELIPGVLLEMFNASPELMSMGIHALRIIAVHFPLAACGIVLGSIFQAFGQSFYSLIVSLCRQLVVLIPVAWLLSLTGNVNNVWWCFLIAEIVSVTLSFVFFRRVYRKTVVPLTKA